MGLVRCGDTERYRNIAHYAQYTGYGNLCIRCLRNGIDVERCAYKAVTGAVGSRQHIQPAYLFPIVVDSQLEFIFGRVGHYLILLAFMYLKVSVYVFQDSRVSGFICDGQMQGGSGSVGQVWCINAEGFFFQFIHSFAYGCKIVEYVLRPDTDAHNRAVVSRAVVNGLRKEEQAGNQTFLVHTVAGTYVITGGNDATVLGSPVHCIPFVVACPLHASWEYIDVTHKVFFPVHRTSCNDCIVRTDVGGSGTRFCLLHTHGGYGSQCNSYCLYWFIHLAFVFMN